MATPSPQETAREYRVAQQTLAMHADLRDQYARIGLGIEIVLVVITALLSTATFAGDTFFKMLGTAPEHGRLAVGVASALAFAGSLVLMLLDPRGRSATHEEMANRWSEVVLKFRQSKLEDDTWPADGTRELADAYAEACDICSPIPERRFNKLKSRYLRKVEMSQLKDKHPGCPILVLAILCRWRDTRAAFSAFRASSHVADRRP